MAQGGHRRCLPSPFKSCLPTLLRFRYLEASQASRPTGGSSGPARTTCITSQTATGGNDDAAAAFEGTAAAHSTTGALPSSRPPLRDQQGSSPAPASSVSIDHPRLDGNNSTASLSTPAPRLHTPNPRSTVAVAADDAATNSCTVGSATAPTAVTSGGDVESSRAAATSGKKRRLRPVENPYRVAQPQRRQERHRHREGRGGAQMPPLEQDRLDDRLVNVRCRARE